MPAGTRDPADARRAHVGYYLIDDGLAELERADRLSPAGRGGGPPLGAAPSQRGVRGRLAARSRRRRSRRCCGWEGRPPGRRGSPLLLLGLIPANDIAVNVVNQLVTAFLPPRTLPKLDLHEHGVPPEFRTAVVIPTLFGSVEAVREALEHLEVQFLANREAHLHFAVLSDFTDSPTETRDGRCRDRGGRGRGRPRAQRPLRRRRRGRLLPLPPAPPLEPARGRVDGLGAQARQAGRVQPVRAGRARRAPSPSSWATWSRSASVRYVITLDADTVLPPDAAPDLVGALAHPLNRAVYSPALGRVVRGYGILQPRVGVSLPSANRSRFAAIHSGHPGVDPYTTAVSDVYQDLYGEGSFTGKGHLRRRCVRAGDPRPLPGEHAALPRPDRGELRARRARHRRRGLRRLPHPLSHLHPPQAPLDPGRLAAACLAHRPGAGPGRPGAQPAVAAVALEDPRQPAPQHGRDRPARVPGRGLDAASRECRCAGRCWASAPSRRRGWSPSCSRCSARRSTSRGAPTTRPWAATRSTSAQQLALAIVFLPHQAWVSADAIVRTLWRLFVSRRHLLEWQTASQTERGVADSFRDVWRAMWPAVAIAGSRPGRGRGSERPWPRVATPAWALAVAVLPLILAWLASPAVAYALSAPAVRSASSGCPPAARRQALRYALLHWRFFERFVTAETHWLAPDNFQEDPGAGRGDAHVADQHRAAAAGDGERLRPGLHHRSRPRPPAGAGASLAGAHAPLPRPFLQLVRPAGPARARAGVHLHRGQRQPRRAPDRAAAGMPCDRRTSRCWTRGSGAHWRPRSPWPTSASGPLPAGSRCPGAASARAQAAVGGGAARAGLERRARAGGGAAAKPPSRRWPEPALAPRRRDPAAEWIAWSLRSRRARTAPGPTGSPAEPLVTPARPRRRVGGGRPS